MAKKGIFIHGLLAEKGIDKFWIVNWRVSGHMYGNVSLFLNINKVTKNLNIKITNEFFWLESIGKSKCHKIVTKTLLDLIPVVE